MNTEAIDFLPAVNPLFLFTNSFGLALALTLVGGIAWRIRHHRPQFIGPAIILSVAVSYGLNFASSPARYRLTSEDLVVQSRLGHSLESLSLAATGSGTAKIVGVSIDMEKRFKKAYNPLLAFNILMPSLQALGHNGDWTPLSNLGDSYFISPLGWVANYITDTQYVVIIHAEGGVRPTSSILLSPRGLHGFVEAIKLRLSRSPAP